MKIIEAESEIYRQIKQTIFFFGFRRWCFCFALSDHYLLKKIFCQIYLFYLLETPTGIFENYYYNFILEEDNNKYKNILFLELRKKS